MGSNTAGNYIDESLPNITGDVGMANNYGLMNNDNASTGFYSGVFKQGKRTPSGGVSWSTQMASTATNIGFDASLSSSVYQDGAKVRPDSLTCCYIIKY